MLVSCIATPKSQARAMADGSRTCMTSDIMAPTVPATRTGVTGAAGAIAMREAGVEAFVELGGKVLGPMITRSAGPDVAVTSVVGMADIEALLKGL